MISVIVNPAAGRGIPSQVLREIESAYGDRSVYAIFTTKTPHDESRHASEALRLGSGSIVVAGGDGTCSNVATEILRVHSDCRLAVIPCGTGNDFAKTLGVEGATPTEISRLVFNSVTAQIDIGRADGHYFLNSCGFGFDASVLEASNRVRYLKGDAVYLYAALGQLFTYRGIEIAVNGVPGLQLEQVLMVTVSNGRSLGGAFKIAPHASVLDGKLDACFFRDSNVVERAKLFVGAMRGTHLEMPSVTAASIQKLTLTFPSNPSMEMDGELRMARSRTVEIECVPRALSVIAAPGALV